MLYAASEATPLDGVSKRVAGTVTETGERQGPSQERSLGDTNRRAYSGLILWW